MASPATRSPLFSRQQQGGIFPVVNVAAHPGYVWWVNTTGGNDVAGAGESPDTPFATIAYAFSSDRVAAGDVVYVMPGHTETVAAAAGIVCDIAGVTVEGQGRGKNRPKINFTTALGDIDIDAANITFRNLQFENGVVSLAAPIDVNAAGFVMEDCDWYTGDATYGVLITVITDATADDCVIRRCSFNYLDSNDATPAAVTEASTECIRLVGADRMVIEDCYFGGDFSTSVINGITTASKDIRILRNHIHNIDTADIAGVIDLVAACNGIIAYNRGFYGLHDDAAALATIIDPSSCGMVENFFSNVVTETGGLVGTAST